MTEIGQSYINNYHDRNNTMLNAASKEHDSIDNEKRKENIRLESEEKNKSSIGRKIRRADKTCKLCTDNSFL